jgi:hypothetical protein
MEVEGEALTPALQRVCRGGENDHIYAYVLSQGPGVGSGLRETRGERRFDETEKPGRRKMSDAFALLRGRRGGEGTTGQNALAVVWWQQERRANQPAV